MAGNDIIFIGGIDWYGRRKLPAHHVATLLARRNRVFYVDNFGGQRALRLADAPRALRKLRQMVRPGPRPGGEAVAAAVDGPVVFQPLAIPFPQLPEASDRVNTWLLRRGLGRLMRRHRIERPVVWTRVPNPTVWNTLRTLPHGLLVYQSVDHYPYSPVFPEHARPRLAASEQRICAAADLVFTSARGLYEMKREVNPRTHLMVNGVHASAFAAAGPGVDWVRALPGPVVGFAGGLGAWIDFDLVRRAAEATPDWSWVLLGAVSPGVDPRGLDRLPNVHMPGEVPHAELPAYFRSFDAGIIPYAVSGFTRFTFPSKMAEYLAAGLPVVSTRLSELEPYAGVVRFADDPAALVAAVRAELGRPDGGAARAERRRVAETLEWEAIVERMDALIDARLAEKHGAAPRGAGAA